MISKNFRYLMPALVLLACLVPIVAAGTIAVIDEYNHQIVINKDVIDEKQLSIKTVVIDEKLATESKLKSQSDFTYREYLKPDSVVDSVTVEKDIVTVSITSHPRPSGGITTELFCQDKTGRFAAIWGGSVYQEKQSWTFTLKEIQRETIDGCYFASVDSTAEASRP